MSGLGFRLGNLSLHPGGSATQRINFESRSFLALGPFGGCNEGTTRSGCGVLSVDGEVGLTYTVSIVRCAGLRLGHGFRLTSSFPPSVLCPTSSFLRLVLSCSRLLVYAGGHGSRGGRECGNRYQVAIFILLGLIALAHVAQTVALVHL